MGREKKALEKALDLIEILKNSDGIGVTELSKILEMNKNRVFRILTTLTELKFIEREGDEKENVRYKLGIGFVYLEHAYYKSLKFVEISRPCLKNLRNKTGETVYLSLLHKNEIIYITSEESRKSVLVEDRTAKRFSAITTASGKVLKKSPKDFIVEYDFAETEVDVSEIATVIKNKDNINIASLSIVAPINRLNKNNVKDFEYKLLKAAQEISYKLKNQNIDL